MNFYCQQKCGEDDFSIDEWNKAFKYCIDNNLSNKETGIILEGELCNEQCFDCMAIVGASRNKNKKFLKSVIQTEKP